MIWRYHWPGVFLSLTLGIFVGSHAWGERTPSALEPYARLLARPYQYLGERRDLPEPADISEVRLGLFAPTRGRRGEMGQRMWQGAQLAVSEANAAGGFHGKPFRLILRPDDRLWGSAREVVELVYTDQVWAVLGTVGGQGTHIAEQVITKAQVPLITPASTDASLNQINIPWMFRLMPGDDRIAEALLRELFHERGFERVVAVSAMRYDSRRRMEALERLARRQGTFLTLELKFPLGTTDFEPWLARLKRSGAEAVVIWAPPEEGAQLTQELRREGFSRIFGGPEFASVAFRELAGEAAEGVVAVALCDLQRSDPKLERFRCQYEQRYHELPDATAAYAYDAANLLIEAIRKAGLNRARIRDALAAIERDRGVTGTLGFDGSGASLSTPFLVRIQAGKLIRLPSLASEASHDRRR